MSDHFEKLILKGLNFFSSEQGVPRRTLLQDSEKNKLFKLQIEYDSKKNKINSFYETEKSVPNVIGFKNVNLINNSLEQNEINRSISNEYLKFTSCFSNSLLTPSPKQYLENNLDNIWKPKFKLNKVISGHNGWVRSIDVNVNNDFFASGGSDKLIKFWDLDTGNLKLTLTGHVAAIRKVLISEKHPFLFSCSEDKTMKCWDLEQNRVVRSYIRHSSGIYSLDIHPRLDIISTGSRDGSIVLWDIRTREPIHILKQQKAAISSLIMQSVEPQLVSASYDRTITTWDIVAGKTKNILTHHRKPVKSLAKHPKFYSFLSAAADCIKVWQGEDSIYSRDIIGSNSIINSITIKSEGKKSVIIAGSDNGQLHFWNFDKGVKYDTIQSSVQPGSLEAENSILDCRLDKSETILLTGECDKTIKVWTLIDSETNYNSAD